MGCLPDPHLLVTAGPMENLKRNYNFRRRPRTAGPAALAPVSGSPPTQTREPIEASSSPPPADRPHRTVPTPDQQGGAPSQSSGRGQHFVCVDCGRSFLTKIGLGVHRRSAHPEEANAEVRVAQRKRVWSEEERRLLAREEALAVSRGVRFINQHLLSVFHETRTLEAIKGVRRDAAYKAMVASASQELQAASGETVDRPVSPGSVRELPDAFSMDLDGPSTSSGEVSVPTGHSHPVSVAPRRRDTHGTLEEAVNRLIPVVQKIRGFGTPHLLEIARNLLEGRDVANACCAWLREVFPLTPELPRRPNRGPVPTEVPRRIRRRWEYARVQRLFKTSMGRAAQEILDGPVPAGAAGAPGLSAMVEHWGPFVSRPSLPTRIQTTSPEKTDLLYVWRPVTREDVDSCDIPLSSAPGVDRVTARQWRAVPSSVKALFYNIVMARGSFPKEVLVSRTVFVPKKAGASEPSDFRPISIASVVVRHLHKILAARLRESGLVDERQRCFDDGCAENITALAALLDDSRRYLKEVHVASLDVAKAFDSVSQHAICAILGRLGLPAGFTNYMTRTYRDSTTMLEVGGQRSKCLPVTRGVRQGDPLSPLLFCLVVNEVLRSLPQDVGYDIDGHRLGALAYADDIILVSASGAGMRVALRMVEEKAAEHGLLLNSSKCVALSIVPAGKQKKYKVLVDPQFRLSDGSPIRQLTPTQEWRYLGVDFRPVGPKRTGGTLATELGRLTSAPLKPQQRLKILRCFLIPRLYHGLVLGRATLGKLRALDRQVRDNIRMWLRFPHDTPTGFFHARVRDGGLGIPSFATTIPGLLYERLRKLKDSSSAAVRAIATLDWVERRSSWAERSLSRDGSVLNTEEKRARWWAKHLHSSTDGRELRECGRTGVSSMWVDARSGGIPGRDYIQYSHVRINCLPTRIRTSRGIRRLDREIECRGGCRVTETAAHVIQSCHRTHGGRVKRHDAVCKVVAAGLRDAGWTVSEEPRYQTPAGLRKPDLVAVRDGCLRVVDAQVVSGASSIEEAHRRKRSYYAENPGMVAALTRAHNVRADAVDFSTCTVSWRGIWSARSVDFLLGMGLSKGLLAGITTRVLQGSHMNWTRWNRMVGVNWRAQWQRGPTRMGVG